MHIRIHLGFQSDREGQRLRLRARERERENKTESERTSKHESKVVVV
jgi:hypothetical protein